MVFICIIFSLIVVLIFLVLFSSIEVHIKNIKYLSENKNLNKDYKIEVKLRFFDKITYLKFNLKKNNMKNIKKFLNINKLKEKFLKNKDKIDSGIFKITKYWKIKKLNLKIDIGLEDAAISAISVGILSTIIPIVLKNFIEKKDRVYWKITPIYKNKNLLNINLDTIIKIKLINLIAKEKVFN